MPKRTAGNSIPQTDAPARSIETDRFPIEFLSALAERESWRKEIYRPVYHMHKWWAKRLGSVFRGILLGCLLPEDRDLKTAFYERHDFSDTVVFDPFMGSGTTVGEAHKLGCAALGRDINPVACESVRVAFGPLDGKDLTNAYEHLSATVGRRIRELYRSTDDKGLLRDVLYFFWVKQVACPACTAPVDLFSSRIFARNAYPERKPQVQVCCPQCGDVFPARNTDRQVVCATCAHCFDPNQGNASGTRARCNACAERFAIAKAVRTMDCPPKHRLYAKLLLFPEGAKRYLPTTATDQEAFERCSQLLKSELSRGNVRLPDALLGDGYNTRQAIGYNYHSWRDFFNDRQLLALGWLQEAVAAIADPSTRDALSVLFSGVLEFNNLFASYKGEGTGAVRHMFSHHILKPERMPIEANVWGTPKSSGSFRNLFSSRLARAIAYREAPFEVGLGDRGKVYSASAPFSGRVESEWPAAGSFDARAIYLSCGSSDETSLAEGSVDLIVTDPPFFDNVHYSELADFFHAWQTLCPRGFANGARTTRHSREVQDTDAGRFAEKLRRVFQECRRVLKDSGLLAFTYHHSRAEGWTSLAEAVYGSGFSVIQAHPVKAELSVATPKSQAKEPIQLDVVFVCRKREEDDREPAGFSAAVIAAGNLAREKLSRLQSLGLSLSQNDCRVTVISQFLSLLGPVDPWQEAAEALVREQEGLEAIARSMFNVAKESRAKRSSRGQLTLFSHAE